MYHRQVECFQVSDPCGSSGYCDKLKQQKQRTKSPNERAAELRRQLTAHCSHELLGELAHMLDAESSVIILLDEICANK